MTLQSKFGDAVLDQHAKIDLLNGLWGLGIGRDVVDLSAFEPFFRYYKRECYLASIDDSSNSKWTHQELVDVALMVQQSDTRESIKQALLGSLLCPEKSNLDEGIDIFIDLAGRMLTMIDLGEQRSRLAGRNVLRWQNGTLSQAIGSRFQHARHPTTGSKDLKFKETLKAKNLVRLAGMDIEWTSNLAQHLSLSENDTKVAIFHHAAFLKAQQRSPSTCFPKDLIDETLATLALLFPQRDASSCRWYRRLKTDEDPPRPLDPEAVRCGVLEGDKRRLQNFKYWGDRLSMLIEAFDDAKPRGIKQWWFDDRNQVQWYTFWVAITVLVLTVFFGLIQSIEGAMQVYKAYHPSRL